MEVRALSYKHNLSDAEIAICKAFGARWISSATAIDDDEDITIALFSNIPTFDTMEERLITGMPKEFFPSVKSGDCLYIPEVEPLRKSVADSIAELLE